MKAKEVLKLATSELKDEKSKQIVEVVKHSLEKIASCKRTLAKLEKAHKKLLEQEVEDLELEDYKY